MSETCQLTKSLHAWGASNFEAVLSEELSQLARAALPLQQGLTVGSHALDDKLKISVLSSTESANCIRVKVGLFYTSIIAGCSCADDPTPIDENVEYCEAWLAIDKSTAITRVTLV